MAGPTNQEQIDDITFESGVDENGKIAAKSFSDWTSGSVPAEYDPSKDHAGKWHNDSTGASIAAKGQTGTAGGTITYTFGSGVTAAQQEAFSNTLTLWSDEAGLTFRQSTSETADVVFNVSDSKGTFAAGPVLQPDTVGSTSISSFLTSDKNGPHYAIHFDTSGGYGTIGDFAAQGGYGVGALTHEIGHMIGLGHSGPYEDGSGANPDRAQAGPFDSRQWSVMSYISPGDTDAAYYGSYTVTGTKWHTASGYGASPETPMIDDILAAQRLYGGPTSTALSGGQVFGFNCNITDGSKAFFDFTTNVNPVITLFDTGTNNTLDCSGFSTNCAINLNPGTFSTASAGTLTNNIGIAYDTMIDHANGGAGNDSFTVNGDADEIDGGAGSNSVQFSGARSGYVVATAGSTTTVTDGATGVVDTLTRVQSLRFSDQSVTVCFAAGTRIRTTRGEIAVEALAIGDIVVTASGAHRPIRWLGRRSYVGRFANRNPGVLPICFTAGSLADGVPARDLWVSPKHAMFLDGNLVPAEHLVNGTSVVQARRVDRIDYHHVELESHDVLLAEGAPSESFIDDDGRDIFQNAHEYFALFPTAPRKDAVYCAPRLEHGPLLRAIRRRIDERAGLRATAHVRSART